MKIEPYTHPAAGWGVLKYVALNLFKERVNGVKAVAAEATSKRVTAEFFAAHTVTELLRQSDYELEQHGRPMRPMRYDAAINHPRMLGELRDYARRGATIVSINPLRERGLERSQVYAKGERVIATWGMGLTQHKNSVQTILRSCALTVHVATKLNRSHLIHGRQALILPTLGSGGAVGRNGLAWPEYRDDYARIRDDIELDDRYRGVFGTRRVVFINAADIEMLGMRAGDWADLVSIWDDGGGVESARRADGFMLVAYDIPRGCIGAYYPETNPLVPLASVADGAGTPTSKSIPVLLSRGRAPS